MDGNTTRFLVMDYESNFTSYETNKNYITTCIFKLKSIPGALYKCLEGFAKNSVNLTKLESFSLDNSFVQAIFYVDIEGHINDKKISDSLNDLKKQTEKLDILGIYPASSYRYSKTSICEELLISSQQQYVSELSNVPCSKCLLQLIAFAIIRAVVVLPIPLIPVKI